MDSYYAVMSRQRLTSYSLCRYRDYVTQLVDGGKALAHESPELVQLGAIMAMTFEFHLPLMYLVQNFLHIVGSGERLDLDCSDFFIAVNCFFLYCAYVSGSVDFRFDRQSKGRHLRGWMQNLCIHEWAMDASLD